MAKKEISVMKTVVAMYNTVADAERTVRDLVDRGIPRDQISLVANNQGDLPKQEYITPGETSGAAQGAGVGAGVGAALGGIGGLLIGLGALVLPGIGPVLAAGPLAAALGGIAGAGAGAIAGGATGGLIGALTDMGVTEQQAGYFAEGVRRGGVLVTVQTQDATTPQVKDVMNHNNPIDVNERANQWRQTGWAGFNQTNEMPNPDVDTNPQRMVNPLSGETDMRWDYSNRPEAGFTSTPTSSENYPPTSEMQNQPGDLTAPNMDTPADDTGMPFQVTGPGMGVQPFDVYQADFRNNFATSYGNRGYSYDQYAPAYRYGYDLASNQRYRDQDWMTIEPDAHTYWEERHPGTWENFKDSIRYAWMRVRDRLS
jgi:hypothetical protein